MIVVKSAHCRIWGLVLASLCMSLLPGVALAYTPEQQQACSGDAFRLCSSDIPDVDRVTVCMIRNKAQLSAECQAHFRTTEPEAISAAARTPVSITPVIARSRTSKPKNSKPAVAKPVRDNDARAKSRKPVKPAKLPKIG